MPLETIYIFTRFTAIVLLGIAAWKSLNSPAIEMEDVPTQDGLGRDKIIRPDMPPGMNVMWTAHTFVCRVLSALWEHRLFIEVMIVGFLILTIIWQCRADYKREKDKIEELKAKDREIVLSLLDREEPALQRSGSSLVEKTKKSVRFSDNVLVCQLFHDETQSVPQRRGSLVKGYPSEKVSKMTSAKMRSEATGSGGVGYKSPGRSGPAAFSGGGSKSPGRPGPAAFGHKSPWHH